MRSAFVLPEKRMELLHALLRSGYKARMHGCEYFVRKDKFVLTIALNPEWNLARVRRAAWNFSESVEAGRRVEAMIRGIDPGIAIETY
ncbi:MAG: hypothetical protein JTT11_08555 [Candidatus Brockarchaeota archaeon]|nr:hypothetical protein [Candidatus Brockarchaeota archaeon]